MKNIFAGYGKIVNNDLYVQRKNLEQELLNRTLNFETYGSVSIVGMQRMGKSSLVYNTIISHAEEYYQKGIIIVNCSMVNYQNSEAFFQGIVDEVHNAIEEHNDTDISFERKYERVKTTSLTTGCVTNIQNFFKAIFKQGKRVLCVIDEFDYSKRIFNEFPEGFNILRELAYQPDTNVTLVLVSRRLVTELESVAEISTLANILGQPIYVCGYNNSDLSNYLQRNQINGIKLDEEEKEWIIGTTGAHPYWMDLIMYNYCCSDNKDLNVVLDKTKSTLFEEYNHLLELLEDQNLSGKLFQIIFGPAENYTIQDVNKLQDYGIISLNNDGIAEVNSSHFFEFLKLKERNVDYYPLWNKTENNLRRIIKTKLQERHGNEWETYLENQYIRENTTNESRGLEGHIFRARELKNKVLSNTTLYQNVQGYSIVEGLTTAGIFDLIEKEYSQLNFRNVFNMDKNPNFHIITEQLKTARNPYQHNNDAFISTETKQITQGYCKQLNNKIENYFQLNDI